MVRYLSEIKDKIRTVEGSSQAAQDRLNQWATKGSFNVKACYDFFRNKGTNLYWTKIIWHSSIMPKHSFILWLGLKGKLLTRDRMAEYIEDTSCVLCGYPMESQDQLFFHCPKTKQVWMEIKAWLGFTRALTTLKAAVKWTIKEIRGTGVQAIAKRISLACTLMVFKVQGCVVQLPLVSTVKSRFAAAEMVPLVGAISGAEDTPCCCLQIARVVLVRRLIEVLRVCAAGPSNPWMDFKLMGYIVQLTCYAVCCWIRIDVAAMVFLVGSSIGRYSLLAAIPAAFCHCGCSWSLVLSRPVPHGQPLRVVAGSCWSPSCWG
ncbi:hypothetical protein Acr_24g0007610 [Actinidia rufa]|uniref:Reverse transcriptase zinc-binding domain-containing protein n=1 Tax=Actinidia rufa TaxID=165716 RepID=A0A7J0GV20_9ERIC|nr:hypothetical protein Acr_24g0007610 [Actinidia rufa]